MDEPAAVRGKEDAVDRLEVPARRGVKDLEPLRVGKGRAAARVGQPLPPGTPTSTLIVDTISPSEVTPNHRKYSL